MADFCYFCKKKIGFFDTSSRTAFAQTVCGNCVNKVNRVAILYNREFSEYTLYSLEDAGKILEKAPSFEMYISRYLKIRAEYEPQIQHYQELAEKEKKTLKEIEKGMDDDRREYEAELKECEKEWKAERASSDYKNELKEYEKARRRGDEVAARTLKRLMDAVDDNYRAEVEKKQNSYNRFQREPLELCEEWKSIVKCYETSVYKGYKQDKIEMRGDRAEMSDFPLYLNTVAGGLDRRDQTIGGFSFVVKIYAVPVVEIIG